MLLGMWDVLVAALSLAAVFTLGPALLVDHLVRRGWEVRRARPGHHDILYSTEHRGRGWGSWRFTRVTAGWIHRSDGRLRVFAFIAAASAAGVQLARSL